MTTNVNTRVGFSERKRRAYVTRACVLNGFFSILITEESRNSNYSPERLFLEIDVTCINCRHGKIKDYLGEYLGAQTLKKNSDLHTIMGKYSTNIKLKSELNLCHN